MDLVTGATGFVGAHVVRALIARGRAVRCLVRPNSRRENLNGLAVGDLADPPSLARALFGDSTLYHCAADYRLDAKDPSIIYESNVRGTENILRSASEAGVGRIVYTSSVEIGRAS